MFYKYIYVGVCIMVDMCVSEENLESVLTFCHVRPGHQTQVSRLLSQLPSLFC